MSIFSGSSVIAEYDNGALPSAPSREYIYNGAGGATTGLLAMISSGATTYNHQDHLSVRVTTDASGNKVTEEGHYPFGELWYEIGPTNKWFFTSYGRDSESGLDYALARYYDSRTGTFCSADPLAGSPGDPQSWNRYPYGRNDPIDITDPSGESFASFLHSLVDDIFITFGGPIGVAFVTTEHALDDDGPPPLGGPFGGASLGSSWNGTPINMPNPGLAGALGLPTMADVGGPINNFEANPEQQHLDDAMAIALQALNKGPCAHLFGTPKSRAKGFTPQNVLKGIASGSQYGRIVWQDQGRGDVATTYPAGPLPIPGLASRVTVKINTFNSPGWWGAGDASDNAETLLHELGHAFNFIHNAGGFAVPDYAEIRAPYAFDKVVKKNCF